MPQFKKFSGNYIDVVKKLGLPEAFCSLSKIDEYKEHVEKDLHRTSYLSYTHSVAEMKQRLRESSHLTDETRSYTQGNFDGGVFTEIQIKTTPKYFATAMLAGAEGTIDGMFNGLRLAYIDDEGKNCAIAITYLRNDPDPKSEPIIPVEQRKRFFSVAVIKNVTFEPALREVTFISHPAFLNEEVARVGEDVQDQIVPNVIASVVNSKSLSALLSGLFTDDSISMEHFEQLDARLVSNHNIDDRDIRQKQLKILDVFVHLAVLETSSSDQVLQDYMSDLTKRSLNEIDFFKTEEYLKTLKTVFETINKHIAQLQYPATITLASQLIDHVIKLEVDAYPLHLKSDDDRREAYLAQALAVSSHPEVYENIEFSDLVSQVDKKVSKFGQLKTLIENAKKALSEDEILNKYLKDIYARILNEDNFFEDGVFEITLKSVNEKIEIAAALVLNKTLFSYAVKLDQIAITLDKESDAYLCQALSKKAENLLALIGTDDIKVYKNISFPQLVSQTLNEAYSIETSKVNRQYNTDKKNFAAPAFPQGARQNFLQRNVAAITVTVFSVLVVISLALILSGVLAPFGIALAAGLATGIGTVSAVTAGLVIPIAGSKIVNDEILYAEKKKEYDLAVSNHGEQLKLLKQQNQETINSLKINFDKKLPEILHSLVERAEEAELMSDRSIKVSAQAALPIELVTDNLLEQLSSSLETGENAVKQGQSAQVTLPIIGLKNKVEQIKAAGVVEESASEMDSKLNNKV